ncbi:chaplin [Streptomyces sp. NPDC127106]|uniref:chaplin n=1 Tax=Streptomyces sp. NPDC127106 TaxID=3345360 RepID=UPI0036299D66
MRHSRRNGLIATVVAGGGLAVAGVGGFAYADADASGKTERSPGLLAGNLVQLPIHSPVNVCGNTVSIVGLLNPAAGNRCTNADPAPSAGSGSATSGGAHADGTAKDSPGVVTGNAIQLPVKLPVNISGNSVNLVGVGNPSTGNSSVNAEVPSGAKPPQPTEPTKPVEPAQPTKPVEKPTPPRPTPPAPEQEVERTPGALAHTGSDGLGYLLPGTGALLLGGMLLYRRYRHQ